MSFHLQSMLLTLGMWITYKLPQFPHFLCLSLTLKSASAILAHWLGRWFGSSIYLLPYDGLSSLKLSSLYLSEKHCLWLFLP